jgi:predicted phage-related endonuclease
MKIEDNIFGSIERDLENIQYNEDYVEKSKEEWHQQRLGKLTASRFEDMMARDRSGKRPGQAAMKYVYEKVAELLTNAPHIVTSQATDWGNQMEAFAIAKYTEQTGLVVTPGGFFEFSEMAGGTPDGLVDNDGIVEVKCPYNPANHVETVLTNEVPDKYIFQIQGNLMVTGRKWCDYISYDPRVQEPSLQLFIKRVERDEVIIALIRERIAEISQLVKELYEKLK